MSELFIGITAWNDAEFLRRGLPALRRTLEGVDYELVVCDNGSEDDSQQVAAAHGARWIQRRCRQGDALNLLLAMSTAPYTLLLHSDVLLLDARWFPLLRETMARTGVALISPEDIGLGNMRRSAFRDKPESSFMFFDTAKALDCRAFRFSFEWITNIYLPFRCVHPLQRLNLYANHVTHQLPAILQEKGYQWLKMRPLPSRPMDTPWPYPGCELLSHRDTNHFDYGYGNFYLFEGVLTHYHNWYARILGPSIGDTHETNAAIRLAMKACCEEATRRFFRDYDAGQLHLPDVAP